MQIIENWSQIRGTIAAVGPSALADHLSLELDIEECSPLEGYAHLLSGPRITVEVPRKLLDHGVSAGDEIRGRFRKARGQRAFPHVEHLSVTPGGD